MSKFCQFCLLLLVTVLITGLAIPSLVQRLSPQQTALLETIDFSHIQEISAHTPETAWGETGATILPLAAQVMAIRNPAGSALDRQQKSLLRPLFGDLVDRVTVVYGAQLLDRWTHGDKETHIGGVDSAAQTYCDRIYLRAQYQPRNTDRLVLLAHELTHSQQCARAGGIARFGSVYFQGYYRGGQNYQTNPLEQSARMMEEKFTRNLCDRIGCPRRGERYYVNYKGWGIKLPVNL